MHFHADHSLFFERRHSLGRASFSLTLVMGVLILNAGLKSAMFSFASSGVALLLLLLAYVRGHRRIEPIFAWTIVLVTGALLGGAFLSLDQSALLETIGRIACGITWILWLGTELDWASLRQLFLALRVPESIVSSLDHAFMHGILTRGDWVRRRDAARLRCGAAQLPLLSWGRLVGEGALQSFFRLESIEENALLRSESGTGEVVGQNRVIQLDMMSAERSGNLVLEELNLSVNAGEWVVMCGPSGAGKSSLLRVLAGLDAPARGTMHRFGMDVSSGTSLKNRLDGRIALLGQNPEHHFVASTVAEDIVWGLLRRGVSAEEAQTRATEVAKALCVDHLLERPCHALSFGEQRRVALAGLLVLEPALLLLDEPTAGLDPVAAHELRLLVEKSTRKTGATCIWATHDVHTLPNEAKRVILLRDRKILFDGSKDEGFSSTWMLRAGLAVEQESPSC